MFSCVKKLKTLKKNNDGSMYIDVLINILVFVVLLVITISVYSVIKGFFDLQNCASYVADVVAHEGQINSVVDEAKESIKNKTGLTDIEFTIEIKEYFDTSTKTIQLGDEITVYAKRTFLLHTGFTNARIQIPLKAFKTSLSEVYWK